MMSVNGFCCTVRSLLISTSSGSRTAHKLINLRNYFNCMLSGFYFEHLSGRALSRCTCLWLLRYQVAKSTKMQKIGLYLDRHCMRLRVHLVRA